MASWLASARRRDGGTPLVQSPSAPEVKGRLNFSSLESPRLSLQMHRLSGDRPSVLSPSGGSSRLGDYHRAKQNPAVLDRLCSIPTHSRLSLYKTSPTPQTANSERFSLFPPRQDGGGSVLPPLRRAQTPLQSPLQFSGYQTSPLHTSLVSLAMRGRLRQTESLPVSPVIVQLSSPAGPSPSGTISHSGELSHSAQSQGEKRLDPCNRDVVISALKQKRKRWACASDDSTVTQDSQQPAAKKSRHATEQRSQSLPPVSPFARPSLHSRKRDLTATQSSLSQALKKPRVFRPPSPPTSFAKMDTSQEGLIPADKNQGKRSEFENPPVQLDKLHMREVTIPETGQPREQRISAKWLSSSGSSRSLKLSVPDMEYESDGESVRGVPGVGVKGDGVEESSVDSGRGSRGSTPPIHEEDEDEGREEEERVRRNRAELQRLHKSLTAVFPSLHKSTSRRKVPVFCATGSAPLQPPPLSTTRSVTQEDLKRDREAARAKLRDFLTAEDSPPSKASSPPVSSSSQASGALQLESAAPLAVSQAPVLSTTAPTTTSIASTALPASTASVATTSSVLAGSVTSVAGLTSSAAGSTATSKLTISQQAPKSVSFQLPTTFSSAQSISQQSASPLTTTTSQGPSPSQFHTGTVSGLPQSSQSQSSTTVAPSLLLPAPLSLPAPSTSQPVTAPTTNSATSLTGGFSLSGTGLKLPSLSTAATSSATSVPQLMIPTLQQPPQQQISLTLPAGQASLSLPAGLSGTLGQSAASSLQASSSASRAPPTISFGGGLQPGLSLPTQQAPLQSTVAQPSSLQQSAGARQLLFAQPGMAATSTSTTVPTPAVGGFSLSAAGGGLKFPSIASSATPSKLPISFTAGKPSQPSNLLQPSTQNAPLPMGTLFKLEQTPKAAQQALLQLATSMTKNPSGGLNFGGSTGITFSSGGPTPNPQQQQLQAPQQKTSLMFGGGSAQPSQQKGGLAVGGLGEIFGAPSTTTKAAATTISALPSFNNFMSTAAAAPSPATVTAPQKLSGGIFGNSGLQPTSGNPSNPPPSFNFGAPAALQSSQPPLQSSVAQGQKTTQFNFSGGVAASSTQPQLGGKGSGGAGGMFSFSGGVAAGKTSTNTGTTGSRTGFQFSSATGAQATGSIGFKFPASTNPTGGLKFGHTSATPGNQMGTAPGAGMFGSATNQMPVFGQAAQQSSSSGGGLFNPSLSAPTPSLGTTPQPTQQQQQQATLQTGFNFTPQPSGTNGFNFTAAAVAGGFGTPSGGTGGGGGALFTAGTPETSRPVATPRRRRGRRK